MSDLIERLRDYAVFLIGVDSLQASELCNEAADELASLRSQLADESWNLANCRNNNAKLEAERNEAREQLSAESDLRRQAQHERDVMLEQLVESMTLLKAVDRYGDYNLYISGSSGITQSDWIKARDSMLRKESSHE